MQRWMAKLRVGRAHETRLVFSPICQSTKPAKNTKQFAKRAAAPSSVIFLKAASLAPSPAHIVYLRHTLRKNTSVCHCQLRKGKILSLKVWKCSCRRRSWSRTTRWSVRNARKSEIPRSVYRYGHCPRFGNSPLHRFIQEIIGKVRTLCRS